MELDPVGFLGTIGDALDPKVVGFPEEIIDALLHRKKEKQSN